LGFLATAAPLNTRQIFSGLHIFKPSLCQQMACGWSLVKPVFQQQPPAWLQACGGRGNDLFDGV
jgi:hypothetical protein